MPASSAELGEAGGGDDGDESDEGMKGGGVDTTVNQQIKNSRRDSTHVDSEL